VILFSVLFANAVRMRGRVVQFVGPAAVIRWEYLLVTS
jgi:hypothetical protein